MTNYKLSALNFVYDTKILAGIVVIKYHFLKVVENRISKYILHITYMGNRLTFRIRRGLKTLDSHIFLLMQWHVNYT